MFLAVLSMIFIFVLGPPSPGGSRGGPDGHAVPREIVGVGQILARIRGFIILILALSTARFWGFAPEPI